MERQTTIETKSVSPWLRQRLKVSQYEIHTLADKQGRLALPREGVSWNEATRTDLMLVRRRNPKRTFRRQRVMPATRSRPHLSTGCRRARLHRRPGLAGAMSKQREMGTNVLLFVRGSKRDGRGETLPCHCLGRAHCRSRESERPMNIPWELEPPMPGWLHQAGKVVAG